MRRRASILLLALVGLFDPALMGQEPVPVRTTIQEGEAWMGARVRMSITLASPGPFSGTAVFQIPEIPDTLIVKGGRPLLGSETIDGRSMITQRHEFAIFTQRTGTVEIPGFPVSYESKDDFLGDPVPRSGLTETVTFESKRPPGTDDLPFVVSSATLEVREEWSPADLPEAFEAGEILSRAITRKASDTSAMFFMPFREEPVAGVRIYLTEPEVTDTWERGEMTARRIDTIKYQFERGGTFAIPDIDIAWWNPRSEQVEQTTLEGLTVTVKAPPERPQPHDWRRTIGLLLLVFVVGLFFKHVLLDPLARRYRAWKERRNAPVSVAARALKRACRKDQPESAYRALTEWRRAIGFGMTLGDSLQESASELSRHLFGGKAHENRWEGSALLVSFKGELKRRKRGKHVDAEVGNLPPLNPA